MEVERRVGRVWWRAVGSQRVLGQRSEGRRFRLLRTPRGWCEVGVRIRRVRIRSRGARRRPERQLARLITARLVRGEAESERSRPLVPVPREGIRLTSGPFKSGRPKTASSKDRRKESVVRRRMV